MKRIMSLWSFFGDDGLKKFSLLALELLYLNFLMPCGDTPGSHLDHTWISVSRIWICRAQGWWLQLEFVGVVFVEVFLDWDLSCCQFFPDSKAHLGQSSTQSRNPKLMSLGACAGLSMARGAKKAVLCQKIHEKLG